MGLGRNFTLPAPPSENRVGRVMRLNVLNIAAATSLQEEFDQLMGHKKAEQLGEVLQSAHEIELEALKTLIRVMEK